MFGAGGTSAAYGDQAAQLRTDLARVLGLQDAAVSWHTARDGIAEAVWVCASVSATCAKMGREFIELSRPEIAEVRESWDPLRGASSTMPQKANPITGEVLVGLGLWSGSIGASTTSVMLAGHERSAGEWQSEWEVVPQAFTAAAASLHHAHQLLTGLHVDADTMGRRARSPEALLTAETVMMRLAPKLGRAAAHHLVYEACREARTSASSLAALVNERLTTTGLAIEDADPESCLGDTTLQVRSAIAMWQTGGRT
jgi:3-carboxy-cis,cis-muconate cycloisomerase